MDKLFDNNKIHPVLNFKTDLHDALFSKKAICSFFFLLYFFILVAP